MINIKKFKTKIFCDGISKKKIFTVGSTISDSLKLMNLKKIKISNRILLTIHRHENTNNKKIILSIINNINKIILKNRFYVNFCSTRYRNR